MAEKCYAKSSLIICTAYRIVLGCEMKENKRGVACVTQSGYRNKDGVQEIINNEWRGLDLSGTGYGGMKHCTEQENFFRSLEA